MQSGISNISNQMFSNCKDDQEFMRARGAADDLAFDVSYQIEAVTPPSAYVLAIMNSKPTNLYPMRQNKQATVYDSKRGKSYVAHDLNYATDSLIHLTPSKPQIINTASGRICKFVIPCIGPECTGKLVYRYGIDGCDAQEIVCPRHRNRLLQQISKDVELKVKLKELNIPEKFLCFAVKEIDASFATWKAPQRTKSELMAWLHQCATNAGKGLILRGSKGTGKTATACAMLAHLYIHSGMRGYYITSHKIMSAVYDSMSSSPDVAAQAAQVIQHIMTVPVLMIDDLGTEHAQSAFAKSKLYDIVNTRYERNRITIVTTNMPIISVPGDAEKVKQLIAKSKAEGRDTVIETLEDRVGDRVVDRFVDGTSYSMIVVPSTARMREADNLGDK